MGRFTEMHSFVSIVEAGSFVGAAEGLNTSKAAMSRHLSQLEARLGVRLIQRTTRRLVLTEEGEVFYVRCKALLETLEEAEAEVTERGGEAVGLLRVNAPLTFGILYLAGLWGAFKAQHERLSLDVVLSDRTVDLVEEGYDMAIRIGDMKSSSLISRKLATTRLVLCASPEYLARAGMPQTPEQLVDHEIVAYSYFDKGDIWPFEGVDGLVSVKVNPMIRTNNGDTCLTAALAHQGIILQPSFLVSSAIESGRLVELLPDYKSLSLGIYVVYPSRKHVSPKVRLLIDFLVESFRDPKWIA